MNVSQTGKTYIVAVGAALVAVIVWGSGVRAFNPQPEPPGFGMVGISFGQTLRLNVVNTGGVLSGFPPGPCKVQLGFLDENGRYVRKAGGRDGVGEPVRKAGRLESGQSMSLDLRADDVSMDRDGRVEVRAAWLRDGIGNFPPGPCRATLEMIDNSTGRTSFVLQGASLEPELR